MFILAVFTSVVPRTTASGLFDVLNSSANISGYHLDNLPLALSVIETIDHADNVYSDDVRERYKRDSPQSLDSLFRPIRFKPYFVSSIEISSSQQTKLRQVISRTLTFASNIFSGKHYYCVFVNSVT